MLRTPHIVVINLDRDRDRLAHMQRQFDQLGLSFERFAAIDGADLPERLRAYFPPRDQSPLSPGEIGCYASHLAICQRIVEGSLPPIVCVLEDDVALSPDFASVLSALLANAPAGWDIIRLSNETKRAAMPLLRLSERFTLVRYTNVPGSTGASLISRSGAEKFLKQAPRSMPVDQDLRRVWAWKLNTFGVAPAPVRRDVLNASTIDAMATDGWRTERWRIARLRQRRMLEAPNRHFHGMRTFGAHRWIAAELINVAAAISPRAQRTQTLARLSELISPNVAQLRYALELSHAP
jgi:glycosyl transferase, family 25